jgi:hypothetical protein
MDGSIPETEEDGWMGGGRQGERQREGRGNGGDEGDRMRVKQNKETSCLCFK